MGWEAGDYWLGVVVNVDRRLEVDGLGKVLL